MLFRKSYLYRILYHALFGLSLHLFSENPQHVDLLFADNDAREVIYWLREETGTVTLSVPSDV